VNLIQLTPGGGGMYCGNCLRDNALVGAWKRLGHTALMVPLYLPLQLDEPDNSQGAPVFFSGVNVFLQQKSAYFRAAPRWLLRWLASPRLLKWAGRLAARTRPQQVGGLTLSMLRGEEGNQARELDELVAWLKSQFKPDVICLSNCLLIGMLRRFKAELGAPVICMLQGEDSFLDALPSAHREEAWRTVAARAQEADQFIAPSRYFAGLMGQRLSLPADRVQVVYNGINLEGYNRLPKEEGACSAREGPVLGFFARMSREKGLDLLVEAFIVLKQRGRAPTLRLRVGGTVGPGDERFVNSLRRRLQTAGLSGQAQFHPNLDRAGKVAFLGSLSVFSVPARYSEAFGLYLVEALAAGVPVVQPRWAAFPELLEATGGGVLCEPESPAALAEAIESLLLDPPRAKALGKNGQEAVHKKFTVDRMAQETLRVFANVAG
jgi:glycosyltransferase involved in cell wall biosynthesis